MLPTASGAHHSHHRPYDPGKPSAHATRFKRGTDAFSGLPKDAVALLRDLPLII